jgi:hypothetical protein
VVKSEVRIGTTSGGSVGATASGGYGEAGLSVAGELAGLAITDVSFTSAVITVEQPPGTLVLTVTCTFSPSTSDGAVSAKDVTCVSS